MSSKRNILDVYEKKSEKCLAVKNAGINSFYGVITNAAYFLLLRSLK